MTPSIPPRGDRGSRVWGDGNPEGVRTRAAEEMKHTARLAKALGVDTVVGFANSLHAPWNLAAIAAGEHVLSEKPFAANAPEARKVRAAGERAGVKVVDGFHYLFHPVTKRLHELVASGELGELRHVETMVMIPPPPPEDPRWSLPLAGGALMDLGCYSLHAIRAMAPWQTVILSSSTSGEANGPARPSRRMG